MTVLEFIAANPDTRLTIWATVEGVDHMLTQVDGPTDPGDHEGVKQILEPFPLTTAQGIESLLTGQPTACSVALKLCDHEGWLRGLLTDGTTTRLYSAVERADTEINVLSIAGLTAPGVCYLGRERIEFEDWTEETGYWTLTGCTRATYSDGYAGRYPANDEGVFPVYPVGTTPGRLEGRYIRLFAMPLAPDGAFLFDQDDAQEIWRGVIDSVPISVDGVLWDVQCKGLESLLNQQVRNDNQAVARLVSPVWEPGKGPMIVTQPGSLVRFRVERDCYSQDNLEADPPVYDADLYRSDQTDWINVTLPHGIGYPSPVLGGLFIGSLMANAVYASAPAVWPEFDPGAGHAFWAVREVNGKLDWSVSPYQMTGDWPVPRLTAGHPVRAVYRVEFDQASDIVSRYGMHRQFGFVTEQDRQVIQTQDYGYYPPDGAAVVWGDDKWLVFARATEPPKTHAITRYRDRLAVEFPDGPVWTRPGHCRVGDEIMQIESLTLLDWATQTGAPVYDLKVKREQSALQPWTLEQGTTEATDPPEFEPVVAVVGPDPFVCTAGLLMGCHEADANGPYSEAIGAGIYACHFDLGEFARLLEQPPITGGRRAVYDEAIRLQDWIGQNLALEEVALVPGFVGNLYQIRPVRLSTAPAVVHQIRPDWQGALRVQSGLGRVVNVVSVQQDKGKGIFRDLDSAAKFGVTRTQSYDLAQVSTVDGLSNVGAAAARLFALFGRPTILLSLPVPATGRTIEPGHGVIVETPNLPTLYTVLSAQRAWVGGREHCLLQCQEVPALDAGFYAPVAKFGTCTGKTGEITTAYTVGINPFTGTASRAVDYFQVGDGVVVFDPDDQETEANDTIAAIDLVNETITLTTTNATETYCVTLRTRATATTTSAARFVFVDGTNDWI